MPNNKTPIELGYETQDLQWPVVLWSLGIILVLTLVSIFGLALLFKYRDAEPLLIRNVAPVTMAEPRTIPTGPLLQALPSVDMAEYKAKSSSHMEHFGWVDEASGKVHIPIDRAMEIALEQGFPTGVPAPAAETPEDSIASEGLAGEAAADDSAAGEVSPEASDQ